MTSKKVFLKLGWGEMQFNRSLTCNWNILGNLLNFIIKSSWHLIEVEDQEGSCVLHYINPLKSVTYTCRQIFDKNDMLLDILIVI